MDSRSAPSATDTRVSLISDHCSVTSFSACRHSATKSCSRQKWRVHDVHKSRYSSSCGPTWIP
ncbi:Uncharacterised protein [Mycobacteroides abscessus subsp. abscessus]|nr:Uncharacterised protein [Mycobacteroides abscessus subsp. abscessus]